MIFRKCHFESKNDIFGVLLILVLKKIFELIYVYFNWLFLIGGFSKKVKLKCAR